jgi:hypothetical protein
VVTRSNAGELIGHENRTRCAAPGQQAETSCLAIYQGPFEKQFVHDGAGHNLTDAQWPLLDPRSTRRYRSAKSPAIRRCTPSGD